MIRIFKTKWFTRWARKEKLADSDLFHAIEEVAKGLVEANLGGSLFKKRVAKAGQGKRGSYRTIIAYQAGKHAFFVFGFDKGERSNISQREEAALKKLTREFIEYNSKALNKAIMAGALNEVKCYGKE